MTKRKPTLKDQVEQTKLSYRTLKKGNAINNRGHAGLTNLLLSEAVTLSDAYNVRRFDDESIDKIIAERDRLLRETGKGRVTLVAAARSLRNAPPRVTFRVSLSPETVDSIRKVRAAFNKRLPAPNNQIRTDSQHDRAHRRRLVDG